MKSWPERWQEGRLGHWATMLVCFALGLLVGWFASAYWLERWAGLNL